MSREDGMTRGTDIGALFKAGRLDEAVAAANEAVRKAPAEVGLRLLLAELLLFQGRFERIDGLLDAASGIAPTVGVAVAEFRQLVRAEIARRQLLSEGRLPDFLGEPTRAQRAQLQAVVALRAGDPAGAAAACAEAEAARPHPSGRLGETPYDDLRDADDLIGGSLEVLTTTGKYFWVPFERVVTLEPDKPTHPRDLYWRRVRISVADGPDGVVYIPVLYDNPAPASAACRLGRATEWLEAAGGPVRGIGQRVLMVGEEGVPLLELGRLALGPLAAS
jgi:type VI secretion system protein ImpE